MDLTEKIAQIKAKSRLDTINRVVKDWRGRDSFFGANNSDWAIVEYLYDHQFEGNNSMSVFDVRENTVVFGAIGGNNSMSVLDVRENTVVFGAIGGGHTQYIEYTWNLFRGIEKS